MDALCKRDARPRVIAIGGPTSTGKTALSVELALRFGGEIINADSMQIYNGLDVGTAKPTADERRGVPHHLLGFLSPEQAFSVANYTAAAAGTITEITARGRLPVLVGGTGLYITSLLNGVRFEPQRTDPDYRRSLEARAANGEQDILYAQLTAIDPVYACTVHPNNLPRVIRALELHHATGRTMSEQRRDSRPDEPPYRALCLCLGFRERAALYRRIDLRVDRMMERGLLAEADYVYQNRDRFSTAAQAIGYKEFFPYFEGTAPCNDCVNAVKKASRNYAKRQLTWFRHQNDAQWIEMDDPGPPAPVERAAALVEEFLTRG